MGTEALEQFVMGLEPQCRKREQADCAAVDVPVYIGVGGAIGLILSRFALDAIATSWLSTSRL